MEKNKKSPRWGCEGWRPIVCVMPKSNGKQAPPLSFAFTPTVTRDARPSHPSPYRKKSRFAKKSRLRRKKHTYRFSKSRIHQRGDEPRLPLFFLSHEFIELPRGANQPSEMAYCGSPCKRGEAEAQLGDSEARVKEPRRSVVA